MPRWGCSSGAPPTVHFAPIASVRYHPPLVPERRTYLFSGHVQGVGFRYTTLAIAKLHAVAGYVRNLPDGRVELVMEGEPAELAQVATPLKEQMEGHISRVTEDPSPATGEFKDFSIRQRRAVSPAIRPTRRPLASKSDQSESVSLTSRPSLSR